MKLLSLEIQNSSKFRKKATISFEPNIKRTDNLEQIHDGVLSSVGIFGKNASGKTSIINNVISYFALLKGESLNNVQRSAFFDDTVTFSQSEQFLINVGNQISKQNRMNEMIEEQHSFNPKYKGTFLIKNKRVEHTIMVSTDLGMKNIKEMLIVDGIEYEIESSNLKPFSSLMMNLSIKSANPNERNALEFDEIHELNQFVDNTIRNMYASESVWAQEIIETLFDWSKDQQKHNRIELLSIVARDIDNNLINFKYDHNINTYKAVVEFDGEEETIPISRLSAGTRSTLIYFIRLINIAFSKGGGLLIQDEINARVHDQIAKLMIRSIDDMEELWNAQLIFTSHTPHIFDLWKRQDSLYVIENKKNIIHVHNVANEFRERSDKKISSIIKELHFTSPDNA